MHFLQIWLKPDAKGIAPSYDQKTFADAEKQGRLRLVASPDQGDGSLRINADARVYAGVFDAGQTGELALSDGRHAWVQVAQVGSRSDPTASAGWRSASADRQVRVNSQELATGDGVAISDERHLTIEGVDRSEILVFDLA